MAGKFSSSAVWWLVDGYNLIGSKPKGLSYKVEALHEDTLGLGDSFKTTTPTGVSVLTIRQEGAFFDTATNGGHTALKDVVTSPQAAVRIACMGFAGNTLGESFVGAQGVYSDSYDVVSVVGALTKANVSYAVSGRVDHGVILHALGAETGDATGTSVDNAAASTEGGAAFLQVTAFTGFSGAVITVEDSADNAAFATIATFTTVASAPTAERIALAGTIRRYTRYVIDVTGSGSISFMVGVTRV